MYNFGSFIYFVELSATSVNESTETHLSILLPAPTLFRRCSWRCAWAMVLEPQDLIRCLAVWLSDSADLGLVRGGLVAVWSCAEWPFCCHPPFEGLESARFYFLFYLCWFVCCCLSRQRLSLLPTGAELITQPTRASSSVLSCLRPPPCLRGQLHFT